MVPSPRIVSRGGLRIRSSAMPAEPFVSYAQNAEDVVLWRALGHVERGTYVDVGANDPTIDSVTRAFYDRGWRGVNIEPMAEFADELRRERPEDVTVEAAVTREDGGEVVLHEVRGTGLSTIVDPVGPDTAVSDEQTSDVVVPTRTLSSIVDEHLGDQTVHFCKIDVEGAEPEVLASVDLLDWRPWVLVVESTSPNSTEPTFEEWEPDVLASGYRFCLFDGLSRFYVADEHVDLAPLLERPATVLDGFRRPVEIQIEELDQRFRELSDRHAEADAGLKQLQDELHGVQTENAHLVSELSQLRRQVIAWRRRALDTWATTTAPAPIDSAVDKADHDRLHREVVALLTEIDAIRSTVSWRVTRPLRAVRTRLGSGE